MARDEMKIRNKRFASYLALLRVAIRSSVADSPRRLRIKEQRITERSTGENRGHATARRDAQCRGEEPLEIKPWGEWRKTIAGRKWNPHFSLSSPSERIMRVDRIMPASLMHDAARRGNAVHLAPCTLRTYSIGRAASQRNNIATIHHTDAVNKTSASSCHPRAGLSISHPLSLPPIGALSLFDRVFLSRVDRSSHPPRPPSPLLFRFAPRDDSSRENRESERKKGDGEWGGKSEE